MSLVDSVNASSGDALTSGQRDDQLAANSVAAINFIEDIDISMINHEHRQLKSFSIETWLALIARRCSC